MPIRFCATEIDDEGRRFVPEESKDFIANVTATAVALGFLDFTPLSNKFYLGSPTFNKKVKEAKKQDFFLSEHELSIPLSELKTLGDQFPQLTFNLSPVAN